MYLLDTNIISDLIRNPDGVIARRIAEVGEANIATNIIVSSELRYGELRADLERRGQLIGANDMFIAAHALALKATLVTDNVREFDRVEGLVIENWLRPSIVI